MNFKLVTPETIQIRESIGLVKDIYDPLNTVRQPLSEYKTMLNLIQSDPTIATAYDIVVDFATHRGYDFTGGTKPKRDSLRNKFEELNFRQVAPNHLYQACYYGDAFLEFRKQDSRTVNELWPLETTEMRIQYDIHGKVEGYWQRPFSLSGLTEDKIKEMEGTPTRPNQGIFFKPDQVMHTRMKWIGSQVYAYNPNESISTVAATNLYAGNYLMNIFMNMPPRYVAHLAGIGKTEFASAKKEFQAAKTNYKRTIAFSRSNDPQSKLNLTKIDPPYDKDLLEVMRYLRNEVLKVTRVPRSWVEESASENRGVTEAEQRPFDVRIQAIHRNILEPDVNRKLLPVIGHFKKGKEAKSRTVFRFNEISRKGEMEILQNTGLLRDMGLKPEAMVRYLDERGILGLDPDDFEEQQLNKNMELNPSRQRMNKSTQDMTQNRNERGVSDESGKKMGIQA